MFQGEKATLARIRDRNYEVYVGELILAMQPNYNEFWKTWVYKDFNWNDKCVVLENYKTRIQDNCDQLLPVVCESGKYGTSKVRPGQQ